jgi:hypothetical protein
MTQPGGSFWMRNRRDIAFYNEVLYRNLEFDVDKLHSDIGNRDILDMSGVIVNLGVKFLF